ncbi:unnamed protein product [Rotaria magnacalcarata]|uniref:Retrotransposon gag domain-containing protein n=2 Tax=Rotaria magnacalcarata TaxID=392030 RepID=A0A816VPG1_9BILA|nr:unnamed protein product [Rotaria magnacalcarata]
MLRSKTEPGKLLPRDIITYGHIGPHVDCINSTTSSRITSSTQMESNSELKHDLLDRFKQSRSTPKTQLKECKQQPGETLIAYYDDIRDLCKQVDTNIPLHMIVDYLQDGLRHELKIHVERQLKALNDEHTPAMFSKIACDEEELHITTPTGILFAPISKYSCC